MCRNLNWKKAGRAPISHGMNILIKLSPALLALTAVVAIALLSAPQSLFA